MCLPNRNGMNKNMVPIMLTVFTSNSCSLEFLWWNGIHHSMWLKEFASNSYKKATYQSGIGREESIGRTANSMYVYDFCNKWKLFVFDGTPNGSRCTGCKKWHWRLVRHLQLITINYTVFLQNSTFYWRYSAEHSLTSFAHAFRWIYAAT